MKRFFFLPSILLLSVYSMVLKGQSNNFKKDSLEFETFKQVQKEATRYEITEELDLFSNAIELIEIDLEREHRVLKKRTKRVVKGALQAYYVNLEEVINLRKVLNYQYGYLDSIYSILVLEYHQDSFPTNSQYKKRKNDLGISNAYKQYKKQQRKLKERESFLPLNSVTLNKIFSSEGNWKGELVYSEFTSYLDKGLQKIRDDKKENLRLGLIGFKQRLWKQIDSIATEKDILFFEKELLNKNFNKQRDSISQILIHSTNESKYLEIRIKEKELALVKGKEDILQKKAALENTKAQLKNKNIQFEEYLDKVNDLRKASIQLTHKTDSLNTHIDNLKAEEEAQCIINEKLLEDEQEFWLGQLSKVELWLKFFAGLLVLGILALSISLNKIKKINKKLTKKTKLLKESHKELNHRVKNNLQTISSLIYLQGDEIEDKKSLKVFESLQGKIDAIKIIHQKLYKEDNDHLTKVNIADYIRSLINYIVGHDVNLQLDLQEIFIDLDFATDIGLMLNELITNAAKYAFPSTVNPKLEVQLTTENRMLNLFIKDNGSGFSEGFSIKTTNSYGLKSIRSLVEQTDKGILDIFNKEGANIFISIPFDEKEGKLIF